MISASHSIQTTRSHHIAFMRFWYHFNPKTVGGGGEKGEGGGPFVAAPPPPCGFSKNVSSKERVKLWFFLTFNTILRHTFLENFIEFPQAVQKI